MSDAPDDATFVVLGAGGLGCPAALALASSGARRIVLVDDDVVDVSNLQRQVLFDHGHVGMAKVDAARHVLGRRRPAIDVVPVRGRVVASPTSTTDEVWAQLQPLLRGDGRHFLLDCTDDPGLGFACNHVALTRGLPSVLGGVVGWSGHALAVAPGHACLACYFETPAETAATCAGVGVIGAVAGRVGWLMAALALRLARGELAQTAGALHVVDGLDGRTRRLSPAPRHDCAACGHLTPSLAASASRAPHNAIPRDDKVKNMATVRIPTPLRKFSDGREEVVVEGHTVRDVLEALETACPGIGERIRDDKGGVRRFVNVFVADEDIRFLENLDTPVRDGDEISIVPAIAGGR